MKTSKYHTLAMALIFGAVSIGRCAENTHAESSSSLQDILPSLAGKGKMIGMEIVYFANEMVDAHQIVPLVKEGKFEQLSKIIADKTDYRCLEGANYFLIIPKVNASRYDAPLGLREVNIPAANKMTYSDVFQKIASVDATQPIYISPSLIADPFSIAPSSVKLSFSSGRSSCFELLNRIAIQMNARFWRIEHSFPLKNGEKNPELPVSLAVGDVEFSR